MLRAPKLASVISWIQQLSVTRQRQLFAAIIWLALAIFCAGSLTYLDSQQRASTMARDRISAEAAAKLLADQSLERLVNRDYLSLQLLSQQILALPAVSGVIVQDVESNPLAQAGKANRGETITVPIVLHDSLAGSVIVNLLPDSGLHYPWASLLLGLIFALPFSAACTLIHNQPWLHRTASNPEVPVSASVSITLCLRPLNWTQLNTQLHKSVSNKLQVELEQQLQLLSRIYNGQPLSTTGSDLGFSGDDAAFRAVCCGLLLRKLQQRSSTNLQLAMAILPAQAQHFNFDAEYLLDQPCGLSLHPALLENDALKDCVELRTTRWGGEVIGLAAKVQKLLDNQLHQLTDA